MSDRISNLLMEVEGIYIYKNNHMVLDLDKIVSNIIDELKVENKTLEEEIKLYKLENEKVRRMCKVAEESCDTACLNLGDVEDENDELKAELKQIKEDYRHDTKVCYDVDDKHIMIIDELKAEVDKLKEDNNKMIIDELKEDNNKHYPKVYKEEADEYFHHNPNSEKLWFFMIGDSEVDEDGDIRKTLNVGADAIAECDNFNGDISVEVYK